MSRSSWFAVLWSRRGLAGLVLLLIAVFFIRRLLPTSVAAIQVAKSELVQMVVATGRVRSVARARLGPAVAGTVRRVFVREGDRVKAGQILLQLDPASAMAQLEQARASLAQAEAALGAIGGLRSDVNAASLRSAEVAFNKAEQDYQRMERLVAAGAAAADQLPLARQTLEVARSNRDIGAAQARALTAGGADRLTAEAQVAQARAAVSLAEARVADTRIVAPTAGRVLTRDVEPGDAVATGRVVLELALDGPTQLVAIPDEKDVARLAESQRAMASADAFPDQRFAARVSYVAPSIDPAQGTVEVRLDVDSAPAYLRPDMTVSVQIETGRKAGVLAIPTAAIESIGTDSAWVRVIRNGRIARQPVKLGLKGDRFVEVTDGLAEGEAVVDPVAGRLAVGARVRPRLKDQG